MIAKNLIALQMLAVACLCGAEPAVTYIDAGKVHDAFEKGAVLMNEGAYQIHASRRVEAGKVERHALDTDIIHVLSGSATLVTGGKMVSEAATGANETRGDAIESGDSRTIRPGDVIVIPNGTPHWFQKVDGPLTYYVVKVRACVSSK